jgi:translation initiation factor IF-1
MSSKPKSMLNGGSVKDQFNYDIYHNRSRAILWGSGVLLGLERLEKKKSQRMIETSGVIEKEQGNGFYLVTLEQPAGHQCLCRAAGKLTKFRIKLLAGDKVLVEISPYDLTRGRITYRERNAGAPGGRPGGNRPGGPRRR